MDALMTLNLLHFFKTKVKEYKKCQHHRDASLLSLQNFLLDAYFVDSVLFQSIVLLEVGTLAPGGDSCSDMIGDLVQNIFLNHFFLL